MCKMDALQTNLDLLGQAGQLLTMSARSQLVARGRTVAIRQGARNSSMPADSENAPNLDKEETFPRLFPRLGSTYQARVPKELSDAQQTQQTPDELGRPPPDLVYKYDPDVSKKKELINEPDYIDPMQLEPSQIHRRAKSPVSADSDSHAHETKQRQHDVATRRGGRLMLRAGADSSRQKFLRFCQPLLQSMDSPPPPITTDETWAQHMIRLHSSRSSCNASAKYRRSNSISSTNHSFDKDNDSCADRKRPLDEGGGSRDTGSCSPRPEVAPKKRRARRLPTRRSISDLESSSKSSKPSSRGKRQHVEEGELVWELERLFQEKYVRRKNNTLPIVSLVTGSAEDDALVLEYLSQRHANDVSLAELSILVDISGGRASKARKCLQERQSKDKVRSPAHTTSESWRHHYKRSFEEISRKRDVLPRYPVPSPSILPRSDSISFNGSNDASLSANASSSDFDPEMSLTESKDDMKGIWRSVLVCGKSLERQLEKGAGSDERKPSLSTLVLFLHKVYGLPRPEKCFGSNHVMIEEVTSCFLALLAHANRARDVQAELRDLLYDESGDGVDIDALQKFVETANKSLSVRLDEVDLVLRYKNIVSAWEVKLEANVGTFDAMSEPDIIPENRDDLSRMEELYTEGQAHGLRSKSLVQLSSQIEKAYTIQQKILTWLDSREGGEKCSIKTVSALVREANRLKMIFPEVSRLLMFHRSSEQWIERANVAIRSRISLSEIKDLIKTGYDMDLDLSDQILKLESRASTAGEWVDALTEVVPCPSFDSNGEPDTLAWMKEVRKVLYGGEHTKLQDLAVKGSRIPVEVDLVKLLQIELDAKNWYAKAKKWIPSEHGEDSRRGKLDDLKEHVKKTDALRERLPWSKEDKELWSIKGEPELKALVRAAENWLTANKEYLEGDNRRNVQRSCLSVLKLRRIVKDGSEIHVNVGSSSTKIARILVQAEAWYEKYHSVLVKCNLAESAESESMAPVEIEAMREAVKSAASSVSLDLDEALDLKLLMEKTEDWVERTADIAPMRSKRQGRQNKSKFTVSDLTAMIQEASGLPINTIEVVARLQDQLNECRQWQDSAHRLFGEIRLAFQNLRGDIELAFGVPSAYTREPSSKLDDGDDDAEEGSVCATGDQSTIITSNGSVVSDSAASNDQQGSSKTTPFSRRHLDVSRLATVLIEESKKTSIVTDEADYTLLIESVSRWCMRSLRYLDSPREIFDKRYYGAFDRFIKEGLALFEQTGANENYPENIVALTQSWKDVVGDQLERLGILKEERTVFIAWCKEANAILNDEKKITVPKLQQLADQSRAYPSINDTVQKVRGLSIKVAAWVDSATEFLSKGIKYRYQDVKAVHDAGNKLKLGNCDEMKALKAALRDSRNWLNRVKRCKIDQNTVPVDEIQGLIEEHASLLIEMPEEVADLEQFTQNYCICRRPYDGFMIGCDECDEWYHGTCIGLTESRADRVDKFLCVKCSITRMFKTSATVVANVIRKWTCRKDLKKARQIEYQKIQRKVRKETKDAEKLRSEIRSYEARLAAASARAVMEEARSAANAAAAATANASILVTSLASQPVDTISTIDNTQHGSVDGSAAEMDTLTPLVLSATTSVSTPESAQILSTASDFAHVSITSALPMPGSVPALSAPSVASIPVSTPTAVYVSACDIPTCHDMSAEELTSRLEKSRESLKVAEERLVVLLKTLSDYKQVENLEDKKQNELRRWCIRVRSLVLVPTTLQQAEASCPQEGLLSTPMRITISDAEKFGISQLPDVKSVLNSFQCMAWCMVTLSLLTRKPTLAEMRAVVEQGSALQLPDEKPLRTLKSILLRASQLRAKIQKLLAPKPGKAKALNMSGLKELSSNAEEVPLQISEVTKLHFAIKDNGARHCVCGGPRDGRWMIVCKKCNIRYHGACIDVRKDTCGDQKKWECPNCSDSEVKNEIAVNFVPQANSKKSDDDDTINISDIDVGSSYESICNKMWPPFGILRCAEALEALGEQCSSIPDDIGAVSNEYGIIRSPVVPPAPAAAAPTTESKSTDMTHYPPRLPPTNVVPVSQSPSPQVGTSSSCPIVINENSPLVRRPIIAPSAGPSSVAGLSQPDVAAIRVVSHAHCSPAPHDPTPNSATPHVLNNNTNVLHVAPNATQSSPGNRIVPHPATYSVANRKPVHQTPSPVVSGQSLTAVQKRSPHQTATLANSTINQFQKPVPPTSASVQHPKTPLPDNGLISAAAHSAAILPASKEDANNSVPILTTNLATTPAPGYAVLETPSVTAVSAQLQAHCKTSPPSQQQPQPYQPQPQPQPSVHHVPSTTAVEPISKISTPEAALTSAPEIVPTPGTTPRTTPGTTLALVPGAAPGLKTARAGIPPKSGGVAADPNNHQNLAENDCRSDKSSELALPLPDVLVTVRDDGS